MNLRAVLIASIVTLGALSLAVVLIHDAVQEDSSGDSSPDGSTNLGLSPDVDLAGGSGVGGSSAGSGNREGSDTDWTGGLRKGRTSGGSPQGKSGQGTGGKSKESRPGDSQDSADSGKDSPAGQGSLQPLGTGSAAIVVIITDPDGMPFEGVEVEISGQTGARTLTTGPEGVAEMATIPPGSYQVKVRLPEAPSFRSSQSVNVAEGEEREIRCQVPAFDGEIFGRVLANGEPVPGIQIEARPIGLPGSGARFVFDGNPPQPVTSGPDGTYRFTGLPRIEHFLSTRETPEYPRARKPAIAGSEEPVDIELVSRQSLLILGTVTDLNGAPVEGTRVVALTHSGKSTLTDAEGRFELEIDYQQRAVVLSAQKTGYDKGELLIPERDIGDREEIEVALEIEPIGDPGELAGRLLDPQGTAVPNQLIRLHSPSLNSTYQSSSREDGSYLIQGIRPAPDYRIWVNPTRGYRDFARTPLQISEGANQLDITLEPIDSGSLSGRMVTPSGAPVPRLTLWVRSLSANANVVPITGDDQGRFQAESIPAGDLYFETRAAPLVSIRGIRLEPGDSQDVELLVGLGDGQLQGTITNPAGQPVPGVRLTMTWSATKGALQSTVFREATSDSSGKFLFSGLCRGRGSISATISGYRTHRETRQLTGGNESTKIELKEE